MYKNVTAFYSGMVVANNSLLYLKVRKELETFPYQPLVPFLAKVRQALFTDIATSPMLFKSVVYWIFRFGYLHDICWINKIVTIELDTSRKAKIPDTYFCRFLPTQARMVLRQLDQLDQNSITRIRYSKLDQQGLKDIPDLIIPPFREDGSYIYNYFSI